MYLKHALPNALTASLTLGGLLLSAMVAGTVLVENVFAWPGLGSTIVSSILGKDYPVVQGVVLVYGVGVLIVNLAVDVALALLDPRSAIREMLTMATTSTLSAPVGPPRAERCPAGLAAGGAAHPAGRRGRPARAGPAGARGHRAATVVAAASTVHTDQILQGTSSRHWAGTDNLGRDMFYRVLVATRLSVELALLATLIAVGAGMPAGHASRRSPVAPRAGWPGRRSTSRSRSPACCSRCSSP